MKLLYILVRQVQGATL